MILLNCSPIHVEMQERCIDQARDELAEDGMVSVSTYISLGDLGMLADDVIEQLQSGEL
jgi:hypothetical protein